jgi:uncharacterized membrane protein
MMWNASDMMDNLTGYSGVWMFLGLVVIAVAVVVGIWLVVRSNHERRADATALDVLRERFARGEIQADEFEAAKKALGN